MRTTFDAEADAAYIHLVSEIEPGRVVRTIEVPDVDGGMVVLGEATSSCGRSRFARRQVIRAKTTDRMGVDFPILGVPPEALPRTGERANDRIRTSRKETDENETDDKSQASGSCVHGRRRFDRVRDRLLD